MVELAALVADGTLKPRVSESYPLEQYLEAFSAISQRRVKGKIVFAFD
jgi:NADPH2:quinone reductase